MKKKEALNPDFKTLELHFITDHLINKMKDLLWFTDNNEDYKRRELYQGEKWEELKRMNAIAAMYPNDAEKLKSRDIESWKGFYSGILACCRYLEQQFDRKTEDKLDVEQIKFDLEYPLIFKGEYAEEGLSSKEWGVYSYTMCPPSFTCQPKGKMEDGKMKIEITEMELGEDEPVPFVNEDGEWSF
jgi:hypothetical protein